MPRTIGIDLGTTNSCVAVLENGKPVVLPNPQGSRTTPSWIAIKENGERLVGTIAKRQAVNEPSRTLFSIKRLMGMRFEDTDAQDQKETVPYEIVPAENGDAYIQVGEKVYSPQEISAMILNDLKETAEAYLGERVTDAVITVPAYFNDAQRAATKAAGTIAGLEIKRIINEPTAAALAYGLEENDGKRIVVYDLGGGTFDVSILEIRKGVFRVLATAGDTHLGGEDVDAAVVKEIIRRFKEKNGIDLSQDPVALQRLKEQTERAKHELSSSVETEINLPFIASNESGPKHVQEELTRSQLEILVSDVLERSLVPCQQALDDAGIEKNEIDEILLVGGQTRMPFVQRMVEEFFGKPPHRGINPDEVVAMGAAIQGASLAGEIDEVLLLDVTPLSLGVETGKGVFHRLIPRNTTVPHSQSEVFTTSVDNQDFVPVHVLQGEREMCADNTSLARFELSPIPLAPRGVPEIEVTFDIDENGILNVTAKDLKSGRKQAIQVTAASGLSDEDIARIVAESEANKSADEQRKNMAELRSNAEGLLYSSERSLNEFRELVPDEIAERVQVDIDGLRALLEEAKDEEAIREQLQSLELSAFAMADAMYEDE